MHKLVHQCIPDIHINLDEICPTRSRPTHILYYGFLHLIYVFRGEISLFYGFHDMFTLPVRVPACNICSHRDDFCSVQGFHPAAHLLYAFQHGGTKRALPLMLSTGSPRATSCSTGSGPAQKFKQHFHIAICCSGTAMRQWAPPPFFDILSEPTRKRRQVPPAPGLGPSELA